MAGALLTNHCLSIFLIRACRASSCERGGTLGGGRGTGGRGREEITTISVSINRKLKFPSGCIVVGGPHLRQKASLLSVLGGLQ